MTAEVFSSVSSSLGNFQCGYTPFPDGCVINGDNIISKYMMDMMDTSTMGTLGDGYCSAVFD